MTVPDPSSKPAKSTKSKSTHNPATPEATTSPAPAPTSATPTAAVPAHAAATTVTGTGAGPLNGPAPPPSLDALAKKVIAQLDEIEATLNLDIVVPPNDKHQMAALARVTDTALGLASDIVSAAPARFPDFADLPGQASYVQAVSQVAARALEFATHVQKSVLNQRTPAATSTLALYGVVKNLGRMKGNETMREKVSALKAEVALKPKNPKPKVTKEQKAARRHAKAAAKRLQKAIAVVNAAGAPLPPAATATAAPTPATTANGATNGAATATPSH